MSAEHRREALWGEPLEVGAVTLTPLVERRLIAQGDEGSSRIAGRLAPIGLVIEGPDGRRAIDLDNEALPAALEDEV